MYMYHHTCIYEFKCLEDAIKYLCNMYTIYVHTDIDTYTHNYRHKETHTMRYNILTHIATTHTHTHRHRDTQTCTHTNTHRHRHTHTNTHLDVFPQYQS